MLPIRAVLLAALAAVPAVSAAAFPADAYILLSAPVSAQPGQLIGIGVHYGIVSVPVNGDITLRYDVPAGFAYESVTWLDGFQGTCTTPPAGASGTIQCTVMARPHVSSGGLGFGIRASSELPAGREVLHTATISTTFAETNPADNSASRPTVVGGSADLSLKIAGPALTAAGDFYTWTLTLQNHGDQPSFGVRIFPFFVPAELTDGSVTQLSGPPLDCRDVSCRWERFPPRATAVFTVRERVDFLYGSDSFNAFVRADTPDPDQKNNEASATGWIVPYPADVAVTVQPPAKPQFGALEFRVVVRNTAAIGAAADVAVDIDVPAGTGILAAFGEQGGCQTRPTVTCSAFSVTAGQPLTFFIRVEERTAILPLTLKAHVSTRSPQALFNTDLTNDHAQATYPPPVPRRRTVRH